MAAVVLLAGCSKDDENEVVEPIEDASGKTLVVYFHGPMPDGVDASTGATPVVKGMSATQYVIDGVTSIDEMRKVSFEM